MGYNSYGVVSLQLPQGPQSDSFNIYLSVNIIDDSSGKFFFNLSTPVQVQPNNNTNDILQAIFSNNSSSNQMLELNSGNLNLISRYVISLSLFMNTQNPSFDNDQMASIRENLMSKLSQLSISNMSSIKVLSSAFSILTQKPDQVTSSLAVGLKR